MLGKKMDSVKKLAKKVKVRSGTCESSSTQYECLLMRNMDGVEEEEQGITPIGSFALYIGEERRRFVVPMGYLSHPLFKMLLEKASEEFGFEQRNRLVVPCSVNAFQDVVTAIECCHGKFDFRHLVEEFIN